MAITLDALELPQGLRWVDEYSWSAIAQSVSVGLTGAALIQEGTQTAGRHITLVGGRTWAWMTRANLDTLRTMLEVADTPRTLTLHDGRRFTVLGRRENRGPIDATPKPIVRDSGPANPGPSTWYLIDELRFLALEELPPIP